MIGESLWRRALFYHLGGEPGSRLASRLGAACADNGGVETTRKGETNVPGLFVAGGAIAGVDTGTIFIENGRFHGDKIIQVIASRDKM